MTDIYAVGSYTKSLGKWFGYQRDGEEWEGATGCSCGFWYLIYRMRQVYVIYLDILHIHSTVFSVTAGVTTLETGST
jgi:hypothetical protein